MGFAQAPRQQPSIQESATSVAPELDSFSAYGNSAAAEQLAQHQSLSGAHDTSTLGEEEEGGQGGLDPGAFLALGPYGPSEILPETGLGGFEASYDPDTGDLVIRLRVGVNFVDPVDANGDCTQAKFQSISDFVKRYPDLIDSYRWSDPGREEWKLGLEALIEATWGGQYAFSIPWPGWEDIRARVVVDLDIEQVDKQEKRHHLYLEAVKLQPGNALSDEGLKAHTQPENSKRNDDQRMQLGSNDLSPNADSRHVAVYFAQGSAEVDKTGTDALEWLAEITSSDPTFPGTYPFSATITGFASSEGSEDVNQALSEERAAAAAAALSSFAFDGPIETHGHGERGATGFLDLDRRATVQVGDRKGQTVAMHEFGHAFGLGDEYETPRGPTGSPATHDELVGRMRDEQGDRLPGAIHEENEGVMSVGDEIRPQHYATFNQALVDLTGITAWRIGEPK